MSLVKKPTMTEKKIAANRSNGGLSQGPATAEGKARMGAAHLRHGFYAKAQETALRGLGEDPAHFEELLARTPPGIHARRHLAGGIGEPSGAGPVADGSRRPLAGGRRAAPRQERGPWDATTACTPA